MSVVRAAFALSLLVACAPPETPRLVGTTGGTVTVGEASVVVPPGALADETAIAITPATAPVPLPDDFEPSAPTWALTPHGQAFRKPVTLLLPAPATGTFVLLRLASPDATAWEPVEGAVAAGGTMSATVAHFSFYAIGTVRDCAVDNGGCNAHAACEATDRGRTCRCLAGYEPHGNDCVDVDECATDHGGCDANADCTNTDGGRTCACRPGYAGNGEQCADVDECATGHGGCDANATCVNTAGGRRCACNAGFTGDGEHCADRDECADGHGGCDPLATCRNTDGGRECACPPGFAGDGTTCNDLDECATDHGGCDANALCTNLPGGRACTCHPGWVGDGITCTDRNECAIGHGGCDANALCTNTDGSFACACRPGFAGDGQTCADVDECATGAAGCDPNAECVNTPGAFTCACRPGFAGDGRTCVDVDECATNNGGCDVHASCRNTPGSYACACHPGWAGNGGTCADVNECATNNGGCDANATCTNTDGSFQCACRAGFTGNGVACADVNECATNNGGCDANATCTNIDGSFECACRAGFTGNGVACADVNECATNNGGCDANATCTNTEGSFECACRAGFTGNGVTCADVNECATSNGGCDVNATCTNTAGSFQCACRAGFTGDGRTCTPTSPCATNNGGCDANATCTASGSATSCACNHGFTGDGRTCTDVNECTSVYACGSSGIPTCVNTPGSYRCDCPSGQEYYNFQCVTWAPSIWTRVLGTAGDDRGRGVVVDASDNVYVVGSTDQGIDGTPNAGFEDLFLASYDSAGNTRWIHQWGTAGHDVPQGLVIDASGALYTATDTLVLKFDGQGTLLWSRAAATGVVRALALDPQQNLVVAGDTTAALDGSPLGQYDVWASKLDPAGNSIWAMEYPSTPSSDHVAAVAVSPADGHVSIVGSASGSFGGNRYDSIATMGAAITLSLAPSGTPIGATEDAPGTSLHPASTAFDATAFDEGGGLLTATNRFQSNNYSYSAGGAGVSGVSGVVAIQDNGQASWALAHGIVPFPGGGAVVTGEAYGSLNATCIMGSCIAKAPYGMFVQYLPPTGGTGWTRQYGPTPGWAAGRAIAIDSARHIYVVGTTPGAFNKVSGPAGNNLFLLKL